jgi:putative membrane protein
MNHKMLLILILVGLAVLFIIQNVATVEIQFLFWATQMPRSLLMFLLLAIGVIIGWFLHSYIKHREDKSQ